MMEEYEIEGSVFRDDITLLISFWARSSENYVLVSVGDSAIHSELIGDVSPEDEINFVKSNVDLILRNIRLNSSLIVEDTSNEKSKNVLVISSNNIQDFLI